MKPFIAVIGEMRSGKSTVIRSLTGCRTGGYNGWVNDNFSRQRIYVVAHSPQEKKLQKRDLIRILHRASRNPSQGLVMAIQPTNPRSRLSMEEILRKVQNTGQFTLHAIVLDPPYDGSCTSLGRLTKEVKRRLQQRKIKSTLIRLDGRRFAHLNARKIRRRAGLPR